MPPTNDGPADERCESCDRLDPLNCPCPPDDDEPCGVLVDVVLPLATGQTRVALSAAASERVRQVRKWGVQSWPDGTGNSSYRNARDALQRATDLRTAAGTVTWTDILLEEVFEALAETHPKTLREELIQVAAVALSWVEDIDRKAARI